MPRRTRDFADLIDSNAMRAELTALAREHKGNDTALRAAALELFKRALAEGRAIAERLLAEEGRGTRCAERLSRLEDEIIQVMYDFTVTHIYPVSNPSSAERISVIAVGGYGRGTLAPGSDIDLLFLLPYKQTAWGESVVEYMLYLLWDLGQKVGHATRSIDECIRLARSDTTIRTAVLEARFLWGDKELFDKLLEKFDAQVLKGTASQYTEEKLAERDARHKRVGESRYLVEPNVKDGKGGQRDLHTLFWIAKYVYRVRSIDELVRQGVFTRREQKRFRKCEDFLWAVRCNLHFMTGRAEERLTFDVQQDMARRLGYMEHPGLRDVERFMKHYFLIAKEVGDLTRTLCAALELVHVKEAPSLSRIIRPFTKQRARTLKEAPGFLIRGGRLNIEDEEVFRQDPVNLIRLFWLGQKHDVMFHPEAFRAIRRSLKLVDAKLRKDKEANRLFLEILTSGQDPEEVLRRMNETGVLGRFVPDFGRIVSLMQFNMYHHYTVDEHLLRSLGILSDIDRGLLGEEHPLSHEIIHTIQNRRALYVAMFLHDIAKGRPESHSIAGAKVAKRLCPRLGLSAAETETVAWLVENHLVMSTIAQSRDLNDRKTIEDFARIVQSPERLKMLLVLTVSDIKAVGPGVWNGWKGQLLRTLYYETEPVLDGGHSLPSRAERVHHAQQELHGALAEWPGAELDAYIARHYAAYWMNVPLDRKLAHAWMIRDAEEKGLSLATMASTDAFQEITELTVYVRDHPRILAIIAGACAASGANIADAQIYTTSDGMALDTILINREFKNSDDELRRGARIATSVEQALKGEILLPEVLATRRARKTKLRAFKVEPQVIVNNSWSNFFTAIEVNGLDRPGLLYDLTSAISQLNLDIASAHITTYGERVVDVFYVRDLTGQKIVSASRQARIRERLTEVLAGTAETKPPKAQKSRKPVAAAS